MAVLTEQAAWVPWFVSSKLMRILRTASHRLQSGGFLGAYYAPLSTFASLYKSMISSHATGLLGVSPFVIAWMAA